MTAIKIMLMIWPFVREMFFGKKTFPEIVRENKLRVFVLIVLSMCVFVTYVAVGRTIEITKKYLALEQKYKAIAVSDKTTAPVEDNVAEVRPPSSNPVPAALPPSKKPIPPKNRDDNAVRYAKLKDSLDAIRAREENEEHRNK